MKKLRVVALMHEDLVPPDSIDGLDEKVVEHFKSEYDVVTALNHLGHDFQKLGLHDELRPLRLMLAEYKPHVVFNLLEEFGGEAVFDQNVVSYLELQGTAYTGNNPRGLVLARDKALCKKILHYHRIKTPGFIVFHKGRKVRRPKNLNFPLIVKSRTEESSTGIAQASVVTSDKKLEERVQFVHESVGTAALCEEYIEGRELYAGAIGNQRVQVLPIWELFIDDLPAGSYRIATRKVKWDIDYQNQYGVRLGAARKLPNGLDRKIVSTTRRIYRLLSLSGYARVDFRLSQDGTLYFLEANPNPDISADEELASAAAAASIKYEDLIQKVLNLGLRRPPPS